MDRFNEPDAKEALLKVLKAKEVLESGKWIKDADFTNDEIHYLNEFLFFTAKPVVYLLNISNKNF